MNGIFNQLNLAFRAWPIRPLPVAIATTAFIVMVVSAVVASLVEASGEGLRGRNLNWILAMFVLYFALSYATLKLGSWLTEKFLLQKTLIYNLTGVLFAASSVFVRTLLSSDATPKYWELPVSQIRLFVVMLLLYYTLHISLGISSFRIGEEARAANAAKAALEVQRGKLIESQEQTRRQIADFLHDRLQSDLVVLGMQITRAAETLSKEDRQIANAFVDEIERIRQLDVREASRALSPELDGPSPLPALKDLISQYKSVIEVSLVVDQQEAVSKNQRLGIYRIVEQALLNAAKHANPNRVSIRVSITEVIEILVENNGQPLPESFSPGSGFAIIDNWVQLFQGEWQIASTDGTTTFRALIKILD